MGLQKNTLAGGLTLALLVLPIIIIASREAIKAVPVSIEQGAMALGATRWQAVSRQVFRGPARDAHRHHPRRVARHRRGGPADRGGRRRLRDPGPEHQPLEANDTPLLAMPLQIFFWAGQPQESFQELAAAGIIVLLAT